MYKIFFTILFSCTLIFAFSGSQPTKVITDIKNWQHPVKKVFEQSHINVLKVELYDKTYPVFYVSLPNIAMVKDKVQFEQTIVKIAKENAFWDFTIIDNIISSKKIEIKVICDKTRKSVKEIQYVSGKEFFEDSSYRYKRTVQSPIGTLIIYDISSNPDTNQYSLSFGTATAQLLDGEFSLDTISNLQVSTTKKAFLLAKYDGPGMNCHERYRIIQLQPSNIQFSEQFGACMDFTRASLSKDTLILEMDNTVSESEKSRVTWAGGHLSE